ncbi:MAG: hypothetical protein AAFY20_05440 [Cyanobacteria bacterium J06639_14]
MKAGVLLQRVCFILLTLNLADWRAQPEIRNATIAHVFAIALEPKTRVETMKLASNICYI